VDVLTVNAEHRDDHVLLRPRGEIDLLTVRLLDDALHVVLDRARASVVLDLAETTYLGCCAVRPLIIARRALETTGRRFVLTGAGRLVRRLLLRTELHDLLTDHQGRPASSPPSGRSPAGGRAVGSGSTLVNAERRGGRRPGANGDAQEPKLRRVHGTGRGYQGL
jgi:anti-anti-sigma factor